MLYGIGCDLCQVERMARRLGGAHGAHFAARVFGPDERAALGLTEAAGPLPAHKAESAAADFAAKEAFLKACGTGLAGYALQEIAVLRRPGGAPYLQCSGRAADFLTEQGLAAHLSLTHEAGLAAAFVVLEFRTAADD